MVFQLAQLLGAHHRKADVRQKSGKIELDVVHALRKGWRLKPAKDGHPQLPLVLDGQLRGLEELDELVHLQVDPFRLPLGRQGDVVHALRQSRDAGGDEQTVAAVGGGLEPDVEDVLELELRNDEEPGELDADGTKVDDVVLVGKDEDRKGVVLIQHHVTRIQVPQKLREHSLTLQLLVQLHFLNEQNRNSRRLYTDRLHNLWRVMAQW